MAKRLGLWAARRQVLERPGEHLRLLRLTAVLGILLGRASGMSGLLAPESLGGVLSASRELAGLACGLGYVAVFGLVGHRVAHRRPGRVRRALSAVRTRSMSCYLLQSVLFAPVLAGWGLGWGGAVGPAGAAAVAIVVWLVSIGVACALERRGLPGPAEALLRRLVGGPRPARR